jgi:TolB-like protein
MQTVGIPTIPDYELVRLIGRGSYGDVWLARGLTGVFRAIKIVWRDRFGDSQPFEREFRGLTEFAAISLLEASQLSLLHVGKNDASGFFYYVMELADDVEAGRRVDPELYIPNTLAEVRRRRGRIPSVECIGIGVALSEGLAFLHQQNLVHRDVKPSNVIFVGGSPKLADIGLVSAATGSQTFVGTEGFVPPEGPGTPAADVFGLGKVLYELSTGLDRKEFPRLPSDIEAIGDRKDFFELNEVILRACEPDAARRHPNANVLLEDLQVLQSGKSVRQLRRNEWLAGALLRAAPILAVAALAAAGAYWLWPGRTSTPPATATAIPSPAVVNPRSIAVLPFTNLSPEPENAFFADGMHEDVIINLAKIHDLKVISRTSVMAFRNGGNLREIAADLGVANIVEGSVRRDGNKVRVTVQLVDASNDEPIWADSYDRDLTDVFSLQKELAQDIAGALHATLTEGERDLIGQPATSSAKAYDLYLRGRADYQELGLAGTRQQYEDVLALFQQAVTIDPKFALAYAQMAQVDTTLYWFAHLDPTPERLVQAKAAAASAARLAPDIPETKIALGVVSYAALRDWEGALSQFRAAEIGLPHDDQLLNLIGNTLRHLGRWQEALDSYERSLELNPRAEAAGWSTVQMLYWLRRYGELVPLAGQFSKRFPDDRTYAEFLVRARFELTGDRKQFLADMDALPADTSDPRHLIDHYMAAYYRGDWAAADRALVVSNLKQIPDPHSVISDPISFHRAMIAFLDGRKADAARLADEAIADYNGRSWTPRQKPWVSLRVAEAEAYAGRSDEAVRDGDAAWAGAADRDATDALAMRPLLGQLYVIAGRHDKALETLREVLSGPSDWGPQKIRHDPIWSILRSDPAFNKVLLSAQTL